MPAKEVLKWTQLSDKILLKQEESVVQSYIQHKLAPFDDYQFADMDEEAVEAWVRKHLK